MAKDVTRTEGEPHDRLTRICDAMSGTLEHHAEHREGDVAIILVDSMPERRGGMVMVGYSDPRQALARVLDLAEALAKAHDIPLAIIPTDALGGQG